MITVNRFVPRCLVLSVATAMVWCCGGATFAFGEPAGPSAAAKDVLFVIPHTHWEGAVFQTREGYLEMGLPNILRALRLLKAHPNFRFVLDQACYVEPFLERYPEEEAAFRRFVREGRLEIVGGTDVMPDVNMPGGESFVRQMLYGKGYFRRKLGVDVTVGWQIDTFGHHAQMPQLLRLGGYRSFWISRGVPTPNTPHDFLWEGLDGSRIPTFWYSYGAAYGSPPALPGFTEFMKARFGPPASSATGNCRVALAGVDVCEPEEHLPVLAEQFNRQAAKPFELRLAVPTDYEAAAACRPHRAIVRGELNPIFQGTYSSRIELKQRTRELERLLTTAEKLGTLLGWLGAPHDDDLVWRAWEPMLFNQTHDLMSGVMTDRVYEDTIRGYDFSQRIAADEVRSRLENLSAKIDTQGEGIPIVVWNTLGWPRADIVVTSVGLARDKVRDLGLVGPDDQAVPVQVLDSVRYGDGGLLRAEIAFVARDVPAMGYSVYHLRPRAAPAKVAATPASGPVLENERYRLDVDPQSGAITRLVLKPEQWNVLRNAGNVVAREDDHGDLWELYHTLDGGSAVGMKTQSKVPQPGKAAFSTQQPGSPGTVTRGPVVSEFKVARRFGEKGQFATTVRLYAGLRRIDIHTKILNNDRFVRYRALFPTSLSEGRSVHEIPFGAIERPAGIESPAQNWIDYGNAERGLALLNRGLPGNVVTDGTMMLSLLRSTRIVAYGAIGGYDPATSSDSGFELGQQREFDYGLVPHAGDWRQAGVYRDGLEFNHPLLAGTAASHPGVLPGRWGFLDVAPLNVVVSAMKPGADGAAVLRLYEAEGRPTSATIRLTPQIVGAEEVNLMEDPGRKLAAAGNAVQLDFRPCEIKTIKLQRQPHGPANP
jgi:alpha-mannosidase